MKQIDQVIKNLEQNLEHLKKIKEDYKDKHIQIVEKDYPNSIPKYVCKYHFLVEESDNIIKVIIV